MRGQKRAFLRLRPNIFDPYLQSSITSDITLWDPTVTGVPLSQSGDANNEDGTQARVVWLAPAVILRSSNHGGKEEFRVCLFEKTTLEPVHVRDVTGQPALWGMRHDQLSELARGGAANAKTPRAGLLARVFLRSSLWYDAVRAWDAEAQEQIDKRVMSGKRPPICLGILLTLPAITERDSKGSPRCRTCGEYGHTTRICSSNTQKRA
jgi:hypothetical protein